MRGFSFRTGLGLIWAFAAISAFAKPAPRNPKDPFEGDPIVKKGKYKGEAIRTDRQRSVQVLSKHQLKEYGVELKKGEVAFANLSDEGTFKIAVIDPANLSTQPSFLVEEFSKAPTGSHDMWLFKMKPGTSVRVLTQIKDQPMKQSTIDSFMFSVEGVNPGGGPFDLLGGGLRGDYNLVYRFISFADKVKWMMVTQSHFVHEIPVELSESEVKNFFLQSLAESHKAGPYRAYNTLTKNCTSEALRLLDRVLVKSRGVGYRTTTIGNPFFQIFTKWAPLGLVCRGLTSMNAWRKTPPLNVSCRQMVEDLTKAGP